ncbi:hypothetical protein [Ferrimonas balearica]|uniref:hypothetical protein n=1 Tax=Ferrimonas balearica TaxID=44012 RepID=UPI001C99C624|nr:hypothetical protein [Ferrimonas balearica]MBY5991277.1 hypothetical protein [Ferrimonas balearica]
MGQKSKALKRQKKQNKKTSKALVKSIKQALKQKLDADTALPELNKQQRQALADEWAQAVLAQAKAPVITLFPEPIDPAQPIKRRPCKGCPARSGGLCKCAVKRMKRTA